MNKKELISRIAKKTSVSATSVESVLEVLGKAIVYKTKKGEKISIPHVGYFTSKRKEARMGRNPSTGASIKIPARNVPYFKPSKSYKDAVK